MAAVLEENAATPATHVTVPNRLHRGDRLFSTTSTTRPGT